MLAPALLKWLRSARPRRILDLGSGNGAMAALMASQGFAVVGCDASLSGIEIARRAYPQIEFFQADVSNPLPDLHRAAYDLVVSTEVIEHLFFPRQLFARAREALQPGGRLVVSTPYHGYWKNLALALAGKFDDHWHPLRDFGHVKFFSFATLSRLFAEQCFVMERTTRVGRVPIFARSMILEARWNGQEPGNGI